MATRAVRVTFFEDRAEVVRSARCAVAAGVTTLQLTGVTPLVHDPSLQITAGPSVRVLTSRVLRRIEVEPAKSTAELQAIEGERDAARQRREVAERALQRAHGDQQRSASLQESWLEAVRRVPDRGAEHATDLRGALAAIDGLLLAGLDAGQAAAAEIERARLDEGRAEARLLQARIARPRAVTLVEVQLESAQGAELDLELVYQTPCAVWRPEHLARLFAPAPGQPERLEIRTWATAWQRTGEDWSNVACRFSTARPAQAASPPLLTDDVLESRRKTPEEKKTIVVEAREQAIQMAGLGRGVRAVEEMPGVEDGGEPLTLEGKSPATVPSDGQPVRIEVASVELDCTVERVAFPELTPMVHVRATATLKGKLPLLAGPLLLVRGTEAVGRSRTKFVGKGEPFELGFGVDDGLRVRRQLRTAREVVPILGTQKVTRTVQLYVTNLGGAERKLVITERVPVSEIADVEIALLDTSATPDKDGLTRLEVALGPSATRELKLAYRITAGKNVQLPF